MTDLWLDVKQALRLGRRSPLTVTVIIGSLALAIAANTAVFSFVNAVQFKALPVADEATLFDISEWSATELCAGCGVGASYPAFQDWKKQARSFSAMGAYKEMSVTISGEGEPARTGAALVSAELFPMLGIKPVRGRGIEAADEVPGAEPIVLISDVLWRNRFGGRADVVGLPLKIDGQVATIVGVMPPGFRWPEFAQLWLPLGSFAAGWGRADRSLAVVARLAPASDMRQAAAEMRTLAEGQARATPETNARWTARVTSLREDMTGETAIASMVFLSAVGFVLLIACANVANLLLVRAVERRREIAIRLALGARRRRIVRLVLTEALLFSLAGGLLGLLLAAAASRVLVAAFQVEAPYWIQFGLDWRVPAFCLGITAAAALLCGIAPALQASRDEVQATLQDGGHGTGDRRGHGIRGAFVVLQLSLSLLLLAGAGLMIKTVLRTYQFEPGYDTDRVVVADLSLTAERYKSAAARRVFAETVVELLSRVPQATAAVQRTIFFAGFGGEARRLIVEGQGEVAAGQSPGFYYAVTPAYFAALGIPLSQGREFTGGDAVGVVIVNRELASRLWPAGGAVGQRLRFGRDASVLEVIGVVGNAGGSPMGSGRPMATAYVPFAGHEGADIALTVGTNAPSVSALLPEIRAAVRRIDAELPVEDMMTMSEAFERWSAPARFVAKLMAALSAVALALASMGVYGVMAYAVARRSREIGIRLALGASAGQVQELLVGSAARTLLVGLALGLLAAWAGTRSLSGILAGTSPTDPAVLTAAALTLAAAGLLASWLPARRARHIHPSIALRAE
jgi:putative ABC transport system permease protein